MNSGNNKVFPILLDILSHKPHLAENHKILFGNLKSKLMKDDVKIPKLKSEYQTALEYGESLGVLRIEEENITLPIKLAKKTTESATSLDEDASDKPARTRRRSSRRRGGRTRRSTSRRSRSRSAGGSRRRRR